MSMDNIGLKQKIAILIIVCVFVPLITTNSFIFWNMKKRSDSEQQKTLENSINAIVYEFQNAAFYGDKKLSKVTIKGKKLKKIGKNAFKKIKKSATFKVPKGKAKAYKNMLKKAKTSSYKVK